MGRALETFAFSFPLEPQELQNTTSSLGFLASSFFLMTCGKRLAHSNGYSLAMGLGLTPLAFIGSLVEPALMVESIGHTGTFRRRRWLLA